LSWVNTLNSSALWLRIASLNANVSLAASLAINAFGIRREDDTMRAKQGNDAGRVHASTSKYSASPLGMFSEGGQILPRFPSPFC
jgi:hypothetical protein